MRSNIILELPKRYYQFAKAALELAMAADNGMTHQLCALVVKRNRVLSIGYNSRKTSPLMRTAMQMLHAECEAMARCYANSLQGSEIIVARIKNSGRPGLAKPCGFCENAMRDRGIRRVYYTTNSEDVNLEVIRF
jgi:tRNA(Arg) A34 adenosine deaminase TadA